MARAAITLATCGYKRAALEAVVPQELFSLEHGVGAQLQKAFGVLPALSRISQP